MTLPNKFLNSLKQDVDYDTKPQKTKKAGHGREGKTTTLSYNCRKGRCAHCSAMRCEHPCHEIEALKVEL